VGVSDVAFTCPVGGLGRINLVDALLLYPAVCNCRQLAVFFVDAKDLVHVVESFRLAASRNISVMVALLCG